MPAPRRAAALQVEAQEGIKLRIREVERSIEALLDDEPQRAQQARRPQSITPPEAVAAQQAAPASAAAAAVLGRPGRAAAGELHLVAAGASIPHPLKAATGGEDAYLVSGWGRGAVAVADGVGGWAAEGVDPALYPRRLMAACEEALAAGAGAAPEAEPGAAALAVLEAAHARTDEPGSCTAVVGLLQPGGRLSVANLGDTSLRLVRGGRVVHSTKARWSRGAGARRAAAACRAFGGGGPARPPATCMRGSAGRRRCRRAASRARPTRSPALSRTPHPSPPSPRLPNRCRSTPSTRGTRTRQTLAWWPTPALPTRARPQVLEHTFNMPLQLSSPAFYDCGSRPADAHLESVAVQEGDVVVLVRAGAGCGGGPEAAGRHRVAVAPAASQVLRSSWLGCAHTVRCMPAVARCLNSPRPAPLRRRAYAAGQRRPV